MLRALAHRWRLRCAVKTFGPTSAQKRSFEEDGCLLLKGFIPVDVIDRLNRELDELLAYPEQAHNELTVEVFWGSHDRRVLLRSLDRKTLTTHGFKIIAAFLYSETVRGALLGDQVQGMLGGLLGDSPVLYNSLNFNRGSGQPMHVDSWVTPSPPRSQMVGVWIGLEAVHPGSGPLEYIVGGHKIPRYVFSNGSLYHLPDEVPRAVEYILAEQQRRRLETKTLLAKEGDMLIWHQHLPHRGRPPTELDRTRRSVVAHFFAKTGVPRHTLRMGPNAMYYQYNPIRP